MNYFEIFGLPEKFQIDKRTLEGSYLKLIKEADKAQKEQGVVSLSMVMINSAYNVLKDDVKRAEYLIALKGFDVAARQPDVDFLEYILDIKEDIEESGEDAEAIRAKLQDLAFEIEEVESVLVQDLEGGKITEKVLDEFVRFKYLVNLMRKYRAGFEP